MGPVRINLEGVSVRYRLSTHRIHSLKEWLISCLGGGLSYRDLWALRDVSMSVRAGETLGVIGPNGAGKSTLLRVVGEVLRPTTGRVRIAGRVAPILSLGAGFSGDLTGVENVYINALLLGRTRSEIDSSIDGIVDFAGLAEFIDSPAHTYSTGMMARLGFAIATAWAPEVLILDEVLSVGDAHHVERCRARIESLQAAGSTVLMASHSRHAILANCRRCIWLDHGTVVMDGPAEETLEAYHATVATCLGADRPRPSAPPGGLRFSG